MLNSLNPWAEIPEDCGAQPFPPRRESCLSPSSCFSSLEASVKCFCNKMVLCQALWVDILFLLLFPSSVILSKLPELSVPWLSHVWNGNVENNSIYLIGLLKGPHEIRLDYTDMVFNMENKVKYEPCPIRQFLSTLIQYYVSSLFCSHCTTGIFVSQNYPIIIKFHMYTLSLQLDYKFLECRECALCICFSYAYNNSWHVSTHLRF